ncbi:MAG TPA: peptide chain release factor-like protein [Tepidisphaeraceae bacterium]|jgi:hypothetical protein|nr:peptide chain release factor-like protein [Tepidisphaeraceae bacterium]
MVGIVIQLMAMVIESGQTPPWELTDERLLAECRWEAYRGSGPGGQKRNKTSSAIRVTHLPTKIQAIAEESRSQGENRVHALRRLRHKLAMEIRREIDPGDFVLPGWMEEYKANGFHMAERNPLYAALVALILDVFQAVHWELARAAVLLGVTNSSLVRFMHGDGQLWQRINRSRQQLGMKALFWDK